MGTLLILPLAFITCLFFTIALKIDDYVKENHS
jgi:hypothetical protein